MSPEDQLDYLLSQYLDGTLSAPEQKALEARLAQDPELRARLEEYARLDNLLRTALPTPQIPWNKFADQISNAIAAAPRPARSYRLHPALIGAAALAACALLAIGITQHLQNQAPQPEIGSIQTQPPVVEIAMADVVGPAAESPAGKSWAEVGLGPPPSAADMSPDSFAPVVAQPSRVYIASATDTTDHATH